METAETANDDGIPALTLKTFDVLDYIAESIGRALIVQRQPATTRRSIVIPNKLEVSASFSGVPFAILGCRGFGHNYETAEFYAALNFLRGFENYSLPDECLSNIRQHWMNAKDDIAHVIRVCQLLVEEVFSADTSHSYWGLPNDHSFPTSKTSLLLARSLKVRANIRLNRDKMRHSSPKKKCIEVVTLSSSECLTEKKPLVKTIWMSDNHNKKRHSSPKKNCIEVVTLSSSEMVDEPVVKKIKISDLPGTSCLNAGDITCVGESTDDQTVDRLANYTILDINSQNAVTASGSPLERACLCNNSNNMETAETANDDGIPALTLKTFDVLDYIAETIGRALIVQRRPATTRIIPHKFEVIASFSGVPFAILGCRGFGHNYETAEFYAALDFLRSFENYSLPDECLPNIRQHWMHAKDDIAHVIRVCQLLVEEVFSADTSHSYWGLLNDHSFDKTIRLLAISLKAKVEIRLNHEDGGQSSRKRERMEVADRLANYTLLDINSQNAVTPSVNPRETPLCSADSNNGNDASSFLKDSEKQRIGVDYSGKPGIDETIRDYVARYASSCAQLSDAIWKHYDENRQEDQTFLKKMEVRKILLEQIQKAFPRQILQMFAVGSTVNGCGSFNSDMDLCLCIPEHGSLNVFHKDKKFALKSLNIILRLMKKNKKLRRFISNPILIRGARVPIIKLNMQGPYSGLDLDINVNNLPGIYNSHLIHYYCRVDYRFPALALLIKHWAISNDINDAATGTFNSYSLILLLVHYLQCGITPAILPNLQFLLPEKFADELQLNQLSYGEELDGIPAGPLNPISVGELLIGFFHYFAQFPFETKAISIRNARMFPRRQLPANTNRFGMYIEEPFERTNTARCIRKVPEIRQRFTDASDHFKYESPDLSKIKVTMD